MIYRVEIPKWRPTRDNELVYKHWASARRRKMDDADMIGTYVKSAGIPRALCKRRVSLEITLAGRQKQTDPFAYCKSLFDALVKCGMLVDDNANLVEWGGTTYSRGDVGKTVIVLEDVE